MANLDIPKKSNWNQRTYFLDFILIGDPSDLQNSAMYRRTIPEDSSIDDYIEINLSKNFGTADYIKIPTFDLSHCGCGSWTSWSMLPSSFMNNQIWALKAARDTDFTNPELNTLVDAPWDYENFARQMASDFKKKLEETKKSIQDTIIQVPTNKQPAEQNPTPMGAIDKIPNERKPNQRYFNHQQSDSQDRPRMPYRGNGYTELYKPFSQKSTKTLNKKCNCYKPCYNVQYNQHKEKLVLSFFSLSLSGSYLYFDTLYMVYSYLLSPNFQNGILTYITQDRLGLHLRPD